MNTSREYSTAGFSMATCARAHNTSCRIAASLLGRFALGIGVATLPMGLVAFCLLATHREFGAPDAVGQTLSAIGVALSCVGLGLARAFREPAPRGCWFGLLINALAWLLLMSPAVAPRW